MNKLIGYFVGSDNKPAYDPGIDACCLICYKPLTTPMKTISLMLAGNSNRSYFYRVHKSCIEGLSEKEQKQIEHSIIDSLIRKPA